MCACPKLDVANSEFIKFKTYKQFFSSVRPYKMSKRYYKFQSDTYSKRFRILNAGNSSHFKILRKFFFLFFENGILPVRN